MAKPADQTRLAELAKGVRHRILTMTTEAASGHPTSSLSATDIMVALLFGGTFRAKIDEPTYPANDRLIFSKGHASPLFYALYATAGVISDDDLHGYRQLGSLLEGHPRPNFPWAEAATGSLGQGLSVGTGMAWAAAHDGLPSRTFVLLGDSEMAEGSNWEAAEFAVSNHLGNLVALIDLNRLGQRGETMFGSDPEAYTRRFAAFGWRTFVVDGHDLATLQETLKKATAAADTPAVIVAKTIKGKGVAALEDVDGWHGKALPPDALADALTALGEVDLALRGSLAAPSPFEALRSRTLKVADPPTYAPGKAVATRKAFGQALAVAAAHPEIVVLDGEVGNSTHADLFAEMAPERYVECYIAEQQAAAMAIGLSRRGKRPVFSTFAAFLTRAHDQIRMAAYSNATILFNGSHAGVSIGQDGPSQMGLEDLALFRGIPGSTVLYPSDATSAARLTQLALQQEGITYLRTTRGETPVLYDADTPFEIGGSRVLHRSNADQVAIVAAGITLHEALAAAKTLADQGIAVRVIDLYSIQPIDAETLRQAAFDTGRIITVEDHYAAGGIGEAVRTALGDLAGCVTSLHISGVPGSGQPDELLAYHGIDRTAIVDSVTQNL